MRITKVTYQKTYSIGPYLTDRVGFEADLDGNNGVDLFPETPESALSQLKELADKWHKENNPHLQEQYPKPYTGREHFEQWSDSKTPTQVTFGNGQTIPTISKEADDPSNTLSLIRNAPSMEVLATFKLLAGKNPDLYKAYCERMKTLSEGYIQISKL